MLTFPFEEIPITGFILLETLSVPEIFIIPGANVESRFPSASNFCPLVTFLSPAFIPTLSPAITPLSTPGVAGVALSILSLAVALVLLLVIVFDSGS